MNKRIEVTTTSGLFVYEGEFDYAINVEGGAKIIKYEGEIPIKDIAYFSKYNLICVEEKKPWVSS